MRARSAWGVVNRRECRERPQEDWCEVCGSDTRPSAFGEADKITTSDFWNNNMLADCYMNSGKCERLTSTVIVCRRSLVDGEGAWEVVSKVVWLTCINV